MWINRWKIIEIYCHVFLHFLSLLLYFSQWLKVCFVLTLVIYA